MSLGLQKADAFLEDFTLQRTMNLAGLGEDYREMLLGEVAERIDPARLFTRSLAGEEVSDATVDGWIRDAAGSARRLQNLLGDGAGFSGTRQPSGRP